MVFFKDIKYMVVKLFIFKENCCDENQDIILTGDKIICVYVHAIDALFFFKTIQVTNCFSICLYLIDFVNKFRCFVIILNYLSEDNKEHLYIGC